MFRLHNNGLTILSLALRIKYAELVRMRINYVRIKTPDVVYNLKIAVHSVYLPFPHLHPATVEFGGMGGNLYDTTAEVGDFSIYNSKGSADNVAKGSCAASDKGCVVEAASAPKRHKDTL
ncbi:fasciclin-like arabinogalactan protein [Thalictrum thalictroides]|uniref:Fasciclin-like arabinogalactan protein n=1 Tax=Thalictrum thalictroides TaxID=46969 RepID=A0A7J6XEJ0_THATH|nr:fasciclin-like arabinogalactan protein [Thalictrum thalictroides]